MRTDFFKAAVCMAWATVAISSAAPADATAASLQWGDYAMCSSGYDEADLWGLHCTPSDNYWDFVYLQQIKFVVTHCNSGPTCTPMNGDTYTDGVYNTGRKTAVQIDGNCGPQGLMIYTFGPCAC